MNKIQEICFHLGFSGESSRGDLNVIVDEIGQFATISAREGTYTGVRDMVYRHLYSYGAGSKIWGTRSVLPSGPSLEWPKDHVRYVARFVTQGML